MVLHCLAENDENIRSATCTFVEVQLQYAGIAHDLMILLLHTGIRQNRLKESFVYYPFPKNPETRDMQVQPSTFDI